MKIRVLLEKLRASGIWLWILGLGATLWFLVRVIPKPSRAAYPCMRAAAPLMSAFVLYLLGAGASVFSFRRFLRSLKSSSYLSSSIFLLLALFSFSFVLLHQQKDALAGLLNPVNESFPVISNEPLGTAKGLYPGRVVWIHDPRATNENYDPQEGSGDYWYSNDNVDEAVVKNMLEQALIKYAGTESLADAWDAVFKAFNSSHGRGESGYRPGEKIAFKINLTNQSANDNNRPTRMDATPQLLNAILDQLVSVVGVAQQDITMGDPYREFRTEYRQLVSSKFPDVIYVDGKGEGDVFQTNPSLETILKFSDGDMQSTLPQQYLDASYVINIPCLKTHDEGGITLIAKNHQGSYLEEGKDPAGQSAYYMHYCLPRNSRGAGVYRHTVDYMGHEQTGGKGLIYIIDGIWAGESWQGYIKKYQMDPFNNDYPSSILIGQDPVALESVGYDILFQENIADPTKEDYPITYKTEISDMLAQYASSDYWPDGIQYDPEGDGTILESMGVFEHWNNATDRQYSRNLGSGNGIELIYYNPESGPNQLPAARISTVHLASPNPFTAFTRFRRPEEAVGKTVLDIYDSRGAHVSSLDFRTEDELRWNGCNAGGKEVLGGLYLYTIRDEQQQRFCGKVILNR